MAATRPPRPLRRRSALLHWGSNQDFAMTNPAHPISTPQKTTPTATSKSNPARLGLGAFLFFAIVYIPVTTYTYGFADDYNILYSAATHNLQDLVVQVVSGGRPIYAALLKLTYQTMHGIVDLRWLRIFGVVGVAAVSTLSFLALAKSKLPKAVSLALALMIGLMPCFQVYSAWAVCAFYPWAALLAGLAFLNADREGPLFSRATALATALLAAALAIYQPAAMMFWAFAGFSWLGGSKAPDKATVIRIAAVVIAAFALDFAAAHALPFLLFHGVHAAERTALVEDIPAKLWWFVTDPLRSALNLALIRPLSLLAYAMTAFIASGLWLAFGDERQTRPAKLFTALALIPLSYFPNLLVAVDSGAYRTQAGLASLVLLYGVIALGAWLRWANATRVFAFAVCAATAICAVAADRNVASGFTSPGAHEYKQIEAYLVRRTDLNTATQLYFVPPPWQDSQVGYMRYDEFGTLSSMETWVPQGMAWLILTAHNSTAARLVPTSKVGPAAEAPAGATVVNLDEAFRH